MSCVFYVSNSAQFDLTLHSVGSWAVGPFLPSSRPVHFCINRPCRASSKPTPPPDSNLRNTAPLCFPNTIFLDMSHHRSEPMSGLNKEADPAYHPEYDNLIAWDIPAIDENLNHRELLSVSFPSDSCVECCDLFSVHLDLAAS